MPTKPLSVRYEDDLRLLASRWRQVGVVVLVLAAVLFPLQASSQWVTIGNLALVSIVGAVGLMILTGFTGQISLGHAAFLALGAYTAAAVGVHLGWPFWIGMPLGGLIAAAIGLAVGPFALRLRGLYLAIVTLGLVFLVNHMLRSFPSITGGLSGTSVPMLWWFDGPAFGADPIELGPIELRRSEQLYFLYLALAAGVVLFATNLRRSDTGRSMAAVRDRDVAAAVMGVAVARTKFQAFGISSFLAGIAGAMFGYQQQFVTIDPPFNLFMSIEYIAMIVLGGIGTVIGAVIGAIVFVALGPLAEGLLGGVPLVRGLSSSQQQLLLLSVIVGAFLVLEPLGLYGIWLRIKAYFMAWPFRY
jgi:branched-chain amino acid transport system permease protein